MTPLGRGQSANAEKPQVVSLGQRDRDSRPKSGLLDGSLSSRDDGLLAGVFWLSGGIVCWAHVVFAFAFSLGREPIARLLSPAK